MARRSFFIKFLLLYLAYLLITAQEWKCDEGNMNIALVYDCRYDLQLQQNFFTQFLNAFEPVKWIKKQPKEQAQSFSFNLYLMTYGLTEVYRFETMTQKNFTHTKFNESILYINTSLCPKYLPIENSFNETRNVFKYSQVGQRKLAIFVLDKNITGEKSYYNVSHWLGREQSLNPDVKRLFIMINNKVKPEKTNLHLIATDQFKNIRALVNRSIGLVCNLCNKNFEGYKTNHSCYFVHEVNQYMTRKEAGELCRKNWFQSQLVSLNTNSELEYVKSIIKMQLNATFHRKCNFSDAMLGGYCYSQAVRSYLYIYSFIGLRAQKENNSIEYMWDDGTPYVLVDILPSYVDGENCFMLQDINDITKPFRSLQWASYDCETSIKTDILLCESDMSDKNIKKVNVYDHLHSSQSTFDQILYKSFSLFLMDLHGLGAKNAVISIMKQKISYTVTLLEHMQTCDVSEQRHATSIYNNTKILNSAILKTCNLNETIFCTTYPLFCPLVRENKLFYNQSQHHVSTFRAPNSSDQMCLYEINSERVRVGLLNNSHLQNCERIMCPAGFVKCPDSYCIPAYLVDDGTKDCPHGEDEDIFPAETSHCQAELKFTLKKLCLPQESCESKNSCKINMKVGVWESKNNREKYVCISNIKTNDIGNNKTFYVSILETKIHVHKEANSFLFTPQIYSLLPLYKLIDIKLSQCKITSLGDVIDNIDSSDVLSLDLSRNDLSSKSNLSILRKMKDLQKLNLSYNGNLQLKFDFIFPSHVKELDLSYTKCGTGGLNRLVNLTLLRILEMRNVEPIDLSKVTGKVKLDILDVRGTEIVNIKDGYLSWLTIGKALYTDDFRLCCDVIRGETIAADKCHAPRDAISTCQDLIGDPLKRVILWVVGVLSLLGNVIVVSYRLLWGRGVFKTAYGLFVVCLGVSDFIMGVYLLIVAGADILYRDLYVLNDMYWRHSNMCQLAGILSTFSSETSTMFICLITLDRYLVIRYPFGEHRFSKSGKITSICLTLIIGVVVSVIPAVFPDWEIYSTNGMCLALPFSAGKHMGWEYSAILFVGLNFVLFIIIALGQLAIFRAISFKNNKYSSQRDNLRRSQDFAVARQLFLVAMSDFCCWFPIGIMGIMSLNGYHFYPEVYAWSAVLILPVNSAINPLIYTFPVILNKINLNNIESKTSPS